MRSGIGALRQMPGAEMTLDSATPSFDEGIVEGAADGGADEGNQPADPLFGTFFADAHSKLPGQAGSGWICVQSPLRNASVSRSRSSSLS